MLRAPGADGAIPDNAAGHVAGSLESRAAAVGKPFFAAYPATDANGAAAIRASHIRVRHYLEPHTMPLIRYDLARPAEQGGLEEFYWQATPYPSLGAEGQRHYLQRTPNVTEQLRVAQAAAEAQAKLADEPARTLFILPRSQGVLDVLAHVYQTAELYQAHEELIKLDRGDGRGQPREAPFNFSYQRFEENGQAPGLTVYAYEVTELVATRRTLARLLQEERPAPPVPFPGPYLRRSAERKLRAPAFFVACWLA